MQTLHRSPWLNRLPRVSAEILVLLVASGQAGADES